MPKRFTAAEISRAHGMLKLRKPASRAVAELLEDRKLLTALPTFVHASGGLPGGAPGYQITGSNGAYTITVSAGSLTFDANLASGGSGANGTVN